MPSYCTVLGCKNTGGRVFPMLDRVLCKKWVVAIRRVEDKKGKLWWPTEHSVVCYDHFHTTDYDGKTNFLFHF